MNGNKINNFLVFYHYEGKEILSIAIEHWNEYVTALKSSDTVTIGGRYKVKTINMVHNRTENGLVIELHVNLEKI
jgi:hypothetical protein